MKVSEERFGLIVRELHDNSDFFDPFMLDEFTTGYGSGKPRPTTMQEVEDDFMPGSFEGEPFTDFTKEEVYEVMHFLETYSDVNLYEPKRDNFLDLRIEDISANWWEMYDSEFDAWVSDQSFLFQFRPKGVGDDVITEIVDEIDKGDAHLMTRNELVDFMDWWVLLESDDNANEQIARAMELANGNTIPIEVRQRVAKRFFVEKGYEKA